MRVLRDVLLTIVVLVVLAAAGVYAFAAAGGLSARAKPGAFEDLWAVRLRNVSAAARAGTLTNPFAENPDVWREAAAHYATHCAMCHNINGKGATMLASGLNPPPPDMTQDRTQRLSDAQLFAIIRDGVRWTAMPAWHETHDDDEIWRLVAVVRHLPRLKLDEMDLLNPAVMHDDHSEPAAVPAQSASVR